MPLTDSQTLKNATWGRVTYCDLEAWPLGSSGHSFLEICQIVGWTAMVNLEELRTTVFLASGKNLRGADNSPPGRARVKKLNMYVGRVNGQIADKTEDQSCISRVNCPCPKQGQNLNSQLPSAIFAPSLPTEPEDHEQIIHRVPVNGLIVILRFHGQNWSRYCTLKLTSDFALFRTGAVYPIQSISCKTPV